MLHDAARHVGDVERAVGAVVEVHRAEALARAGQKFPAFIRVLRGDPAVLFREDEALHEVRRRLGGERVAAELRREGVAAIDQRPARPGELLQLPRVVEHAFAVAAVHAGRHPRGEDALALGDLHIRALGFLEVRVARQIRGRQQIAEELLLARARVDAPEVVLRDAPLPVENRGLAHKRVVRLDLVAPARFRAVIPAVHREQQAIGLMLRVAAAGVIRDEHVAAVGHQIAVRVRTPQDVRRLADQRPAFAQRDGARHDQLVQKHRVLVHAPVAVGVLQHHHATIRRILAGAVEIAHVAVHFHHPEPPVLVPLHRHRGRDHRLGGHQLHTETRRDREGLQHFLRRQHRGRRDRDARGKRGHVLRGASDWEEGSGAGEQQSGEFHWESW